MLAAGQAFGVATAQDGIELSRQTELPRLIDLAADQLGINIEYEPAAISGTLNVSLGAAMTNEELWALTNRALFMRGLTTVQTPGADDAVTVVRLADAAGSARVETPGQPGLAGFVTVLAELEHQTPAAVIPLLESVLSKKSGSARPVGESGRILISDMRPRVEQAVMLLLEIDTPTDEPVVRTIPAERVDATRLANQVNAAATAREAIGAPVYAGRVSPTVDGRSLLLVCPPSSEAFWIDLIGRFDQQEPLETRTYLPEHHGLSDVSRLIEQSAKLTPPLGAGDRWQIVTDSLTGSLIVTASPSEHDRIGALLERLNVAPADARTVVRSFTVRNREVTEVADVLARLIESGALLRESVADQTTPNGTGREGPDITLTVDAPTSTLFAVGDPLDLDRIASMVETLDVRQAQVMVEVIMVTITDSDTLDLGVELEKMEISGDTMISLSSLFGLSSVTNGVRGVTDGRGFSGVVIDPGDFSVIVRALETINDGRTLDRPKLLVRNNQQATIDSVQQQPTVSVNASDTVATTSFGGFEDAGTQVTVQPQIAAGDHLLLEYTVTLSTFVGESSDPATPPPRQENTLTSSILIPDGFTIAVGGFEVMSDTEAVSQVPLLGSIPLIGEAFKNRSNSRNRSKFYVFLRCEVMRDSMFEDLKHISRLATEAADVDDGWPEVRPLIIR